MKEVYRHSDYSRVVYFRNLLENQGISTFIRNENLNSLEVNIPVFFPNICVMDDERFEEACKLLKKWIDEHDSRIVLDIKCPQCGEINPDSFEVCFNCGADLTG